MKKLYAILILASGLLVLSACSSPAEQVPSEEEGLTLTLEELADYDGKDGKPAYIAVEGIIYDVTGVPQWTEGEHNGYGAGRDLTEEMRDESPHGLSKLKLVPAVGELAE